MDYTINLNNITLANGYSLDFQYPIKEAVNIEDVIILVLDPQTEIRYNQNVFAIDRFGDFLWRIRENLLLGGGSYGNGENDCPYMGVIINQQNELVLFNWCDTAVIVNPRTGEVIRKYQTK